MYLNNSRTGYFVTMQDEPSQLRHAALRRLTQVWIDSPIFFLTVCVQARRELLASEAVHAVLREVWETGHQRHGWQVGRYVIMPDHVHFFARAQPAGKPLSGFMRDWKRWTANEIIKAHQFRPPLWQPEFFDHLLRSADSYSAKWDYVSNNSVRAGLTTSPSAWPYSGECESLTF